MKANHLGKDTFIGKKSMIRLESVWKLFHEQKLRETIRRLAKTRIGSIVFMLLQLLLGIFLVYKFLAPIICR
jgi:hypothetical protein